MPIIEQITSYSSTYFPVNSTGGMLYDWGIYLDDNVTPANSSHYTLEVGSSLSDEEIHLRWHIVGDYKIRLNVTQENCGIFKNSNVLSVNVTGDSITPVGCVNFSYSGGASGGTISYTFCDGISVETVAVAPNEQSSLCCLESPAPTFTGTVTGSVAGDCTPVSTYNKDVILSYWLQDSNDFHNCSPGDPLYPNCNPNDYDTSLRSNGAEGRLKSYIRRDLLKPPFYAEFHEVRTIGDNTGFTGQTDYNVRFDQQAFDRTMAFIYETGVKAVELYFYDDDSDVAEHITYNQTTSSPFALALKYCYALGGLGYNVVPTMNRIVDHMGQSRYYKINNRPVLTIDGPEGQKFHVDRYIEQSGATWNVDANEPGGGYWSQNAGYSGQILFEPTAGFVRASGNTPNKRFIEYIVQRYSALNGGVIPYLVIEGTFFYHDGSGGFNQDAVSAYLNVHPTFNNDHSYQALINYNMSQLGSITQKIVPTITAGLNNIKKDGQEPNYVNTPTEGELLNHFDLVNAYALGSNVDAVKSYSVGESGECGQSNFLPRKNPDGSYDKTYINILKKAITS